MAVITGTLLALKGAGALMAKKTAAVAAKGAAKGAMKAKAKDFVKGKIKGKIKSIAKDKLLGGGGGEGYGGALVKRGSVGSALVKTETTNTVKQEANIAAAGRSGGSPLLNEVIEIKITTIQIKDLLASNLAQQKAADAAARKQAEKDRKAEKEAQLESGAGGGGGGMKMPKGPKVGPFEAIKRFLLMTFLGALLAFLLKHHKKVLAVFNFLTKNITATIKIFLALRKLFRMAVAKLLKGTLGLAKKLGAGTFNLIKKAIKSTGTIVFNALKTAGNALFNFLKATIEAALKFADDVAKGVATLGKEFLKRGAQVSRYLKRVYRATTGAIRGGQGVKGAFDAAKTATQRSMQSASKRAAQEAAEKAAQEATEKAAQEAAEKAAQEGIEKVTQEGIEKVAQEGAEKVAQEAAEKVAQEAAEKVAQEAAEKVVQEGAEQAVKKAGQSTLSRIPFLGGLITCIVSLASGEPVAQALFKTAGAVLGGFLGSFIPIPVIGTLIGELLGEYVGDLFYTGLMGGGMDAVGKKMQEDITSLLKAGKFVADWIGDGFGRLNEGIPSYLGVKNYLVLFNPIESVPLFYKAFFTRDSMTGKEEKEPEVEQKFLGGVVSAAKDFLGMGGKEDGGMAMGSISASGNVKEPKKLPGLSLTRIPLKGGETYVGVRYKNNALSKGLGSIFGGNFGLGSIFGGNTGSNGGGIIRSDGPPSLGSTDVQANIQAILKAAKDMNYTGDILALLAIAKGESGIKGIPEQPITDAGRASQIWSISRAEAQQLLDSGGWRALYNEVYGWSGNSLGNRPGTNDGSDFIGRGFIQITGRHNYKDIGNRIGVDFMSNPELLLDKDIAAKATIAFMQRGGSPRDMESALRAVGGIKEGWPKKRGFYEDFKQLASEGKLKLNSAQIASKDSSDADIEPVTPRKPTPDNNDKSTSKDKLPGTGDESSDSILIDPSKPPSIQNIIHPDLMAGGTFGAGFNMAGGVTRSDSKGEVSKLKPSMMNIGSGSGPKPTQNASFGSVNTKNYQIQESAHYDEPSAQIIIMPPPQQSSQPQRKLASNTGKSNGVPPLFPLNRDINDIVSQAAFY